MESALWIITAMRLVFMTEFAEKKFLESKYTSLPVISVEASKQRLVMAHLNASGPVKGRPYNLGGGEVVISQLDYLGDSVSYHVKHAQDLNLLKRDEDMIGEIDRSHIKDVKDFVKAKKRYLELVQRIMDERWLVKKSRSGTQVKVAQELKSCWDIIHEDKLMPFYWNRARHMMDWMNHYSSLGTK